jgi:hypothetical protein
VAKDVAFPEAATKQQGENLGFVLNTVEGRGVKLTAVLVVPKDKLGYAFLMEVGVAVSIKDAIRVLRVVPYFVKHMAGEIVVYLQVALRVPKEARHCAKDTVVENVACTMAVVFVQRVCTVVLIFALPMVVERDVSCQSARGVHVAVRIHA